MKTLSQLWNERSITAKFDIAFGILLALIVVVAMSSFIALTIVRQQMETAILSSTEIQRLVLQMEYGLERARRLQRDFFLQYPEIGFSQARDTYAAQAVQQISELIVQSTRLQRLIADSNVSMALQERDTDLDLYLSSATRYRDIFLETVDIVANLTEKETGWEAELQDHAKQMHEIVLATDDVALIALCYEMQAIEKNYLLTRQVSALYAMNNVESRLRVSISNTLALTPSEKAEALACLDQYHTVAETIVNLDANIREKYRDFEAKSQYLEPISVKLLTLAEAEVTRARATIERASAITTGVLFSVAVTGFVVALLIRQRFNVNITQKIVDLTQAAGEVQRGNLDVQAHTESADELGHLARSFNAMAAEIKAKINAMSRLNEAVQKNELKYRKLFENSQDTIAITTPDGTIVDFNVAGERLLKYTREQLFGQKVMAFYAHPEDRVRLLRALAQDGSASDFETQLVRSDGTIVDVLLTANVQYAEDGSVAAFQTIIHDISERKQIQQAVLQSQERFNLAMEATNTGLWEFYPRSGEVYFSPGWFTMLGYEPDVFPHSYETWANLLHPDDHSKSEQFVQTFIEEKGDVYHIEFRMRASDGQWRWISAMGKTVTRDAEGNVVRLLGTHSDITERKIAEEERLTLLARIQKQAQRLQQIMDTVPEGMLLLDSACRVLLANPQGQVYLSLLATAPENESLSRLGDRELSELLTSPPVGRWHEVISGDLVFEVIARPIELGNIMTQSNQAGDETWVMVLRDVTEQRNIQRQAQQQQRLAAVGQLAAGIAHDFNNIMASIMLYAQMTARTQELPERIRARMTTINQQASHATNLIQQILDFSRRAVLERRALDLAPLLKEQIKLLQRTLPESIKVMDLDYQSDEYIINGDPTRIQQMLMNLAVNARDAMPDGGELRFTLERIHITDAQKVPVHGMTTGIWLKLCVSDTGTGIPPDVLPRIYEPFFTTKAPDKGTGLGLSQVYGIVGAHEGYLAVQTRLATDILLSDELPGTVFSIYLPELNLYTAPSLKQEAADLVQGHKELILLVEDNDSTRQALVDSLELLNYTVMTAENGKEGLRLLEQYCNEIALILSDVVMPEMGGIALLNAVRDLPCPVNIVLLSGHPLETELQTLQAKDANATSPRLAGWLLKPPKLEQLAEVIAQGLRKI